MTIHEAAETWSVKEKTVLDYIMKGYIYNLAIDNNEIVFPEIPKPYIKKKPKNINEQDKYILNAMNQEQYVNAKILGIAQDKFAERIDILVSKQMIIPRNKENNDKLSNLDYILAPTTNGHINLSLAPTLMLADQIGFVNGRIG